LYRGSYCRYRYLNFDKLPEYVAQADKVKLSDDYMPALQAELAKLKAEKADSA
jgi:hypothetical protein